VKSLIVALIILSVVIFTTVGGALLTDSRLSDFKSTVEHAIPNGVQDAAKIREGAEKIEAEYERLQKFIILFIHDDGVREIEEHISDIKSSADADEVSDAIIAKSRLILHIEQLRRLSKFSTEAIF
jgi:hypothetical protein